MAFVQFTNVSVAFGARDIIKDAALYISAGTKAALAGANGAGKTTLLRVIAGLLVPDYGDRAVQKGTRVSYLPQSGAVFSQHSVYAEAERAYDALAALLSERDAIAEQLESMQEDDRGIQAMLESYHHLDETIQNSGYWHRKEKIEEVLFGLGFSKDDMERRAGEMSGGWQMRLALAKTLLESPDIMLLDEPTNYLDIEARYWLENYLVNFQGGFVIVSHDRSFLDAVIREVYELFNAALSRYPGSYTEYEKKIRVDRETLFKAWQAQQDEIAHLENFIQRFRYKASKAAQVQSRVKQLEKIEPIVIPESMKRMHFSFPPAPHSGKIALSIENLKKKYGDKAVLDTLNLTIDAGSKIAFVGKNGAGKSTLMRLIAGRDSDYAGNIRLGTGIVSAYFSQDMADGLDNAKTVEDEAAAECPTQLIPSLRNMLGAFLFRGDDVAKPVSVLSGGERSRLALLKMLLHPANLIILDEPTNHLDLASKDLLLDALRRFTGTVLFVSHDKFFIDGLAGAILELSCGASPRLYYGDYSYYMSKKAEENGSASHAAPPPKTASDAQAARALQKKQKADSARQKKLEEELLSRIDALEKEHAETLAAMAAPANYTDGKAIKRLRERASGIEAESAELLAAWEKLMDASR